MKSENTIINNNIVNSNAQEKKLIVLDFDQTITLNLGRASSFLCFNLANKYKRGIITKTKLLNNVFGTYDRINKLKDALKQQKSKGNSIIILSFNTHETVSICLEVAGLSELITNNDIYGIEYIGRNTKALTLIRLNIEIYNKKFLLKNIILFDDNISNCSYARDFGISYQYIYGNSGMQDKEFTILKNL